MKDTKKVMIIVEFVSKAKKILQREREREREREKVTSVLIVCLDIRTHGYLDFRIYR